MYWRICKQQNIATCYVLARIEIDLSKLKKELEILRQPQIRAMMLRENVRYYEGEKSSKYFCNFEKHYLTNTLVSRLNVNENIIQNPGDIINKMRAYYKKNFTVQNYQMYQNLIF